MSGFFFTQYSITESPSTSGNCLNATFAKSTFKRQNTDAFNRVLDRRTTK